MADGLAIATIDEGDQILCKLAMKHQFVGEEQVREAVVFQRMEHDKGHDMSIGDIMLDRGMISRKQLEFLQTTKMFLVMRQPDCVFARVAVKSNLITQQQSENALQLQAKVFRETRIFKPVGDLLVEAGILSPQKRDAIQTTLQRLLKEKSPATEPDCKEEKLRAQPAGQMAGQTSVEPASAQPGIAAGSPADSDADDEFTGTVITGSVIADEIFYEILLCDDGVTAFLRLKSEPPMHVTAESIKKLMTSKGIVHGAVDDTLIEGYLRLKGAQRRPLKIAEGTFPKPGKDAEIHYLFDTKPSLDDVVLSDDKTIDLKNRGVICQVKQGELLAEKYPRIPEAPGVDVFGKKLAINQARDTRFLLGTGVELSGDGLKVYAKIDGRPELSVLGRLSVLPELYVDGDVSFETGNIAFEGSIIVQGVVQDGFRIKGRALTAREIAKAELDIAGDITAYGGILGATIRSQGHVRAVHIHTAKIEAQGNVIVEKGIFDSRISTSGKCVAERGKILSSKIIAKMGVEANFIGSDLSQPSTLVVGIDPVTEKHVESLKSSLAVKEKEKIRHREFIEKLEEQSLQSELRIGELAQVQDRGALKKKSLLEKLQELEKINDSEKIAKVESVLLELDSKIKSAESELDKLFDFQDQIKAKISEHSQKIKEIEEAAKTIRDELDVIAEWFREHPGLAVVKTFGTAYAGTIIRGPFSALTLSSNARSALIRETQETDNTEGTVSGRWKITIQSLF